MRERIAAPAHPEGIERAVGLHLVDQRGAGLPRDGEDAAFHEVDEEEHEERRLADRQREVRPDRHGDGKGRERDEVAEELVFGHEPPEACLPHRAFRHDAEPAPEELARGRRDVEHGGVQDAGGGGVEDHGDIFGSTLRSYPA